MGKTKAQEREALAKIREILDGFDPEDTYIGKAFEGCIEQADENLGCDWMMSYKDRYDNVSELLHAANVRVAELAKQLNYKDDTIARLEDAKKEYEKLIAQRDDNRQELLEKLSDAKEKVEDLKQTILELKAKLYDMMTGEEVKG